MTHTISPTPVYTFQDDESSKELSARDEWQELMHQTAIQSQLGRVVVLPRWAEGMQPWKAS